MIYSCAIGADHRGYHLKNDLITHYDKRHQLIDVGTHSPERTDYPIFAEAAVNTLLTGAAECAILICGTGAGMAITANRHPKIYAAIAWNIDIARRIKEEDNCMIIVLPADYLTLSHAIALIDVWHTAEFKKGRYEDRIALIDKNRDY
jgi:ribose 5-phosphate isomerase B